MLCCAVLWPAGALRHHERECHGDEGVPAGGVHTHAYSCMLTRLTNKDRNNGAGAERQGVPCFPCVQLWVAPHITALWVGWRHHAVFTAWVGLCKPCSRALPTPRGHNPRGCCAHSHGGDLALSQHTPQSNTTPWCLQHNPAGASCEGLKAHWSHVTHGIHHQPLWAAIGDMTISHPGNVSHTGRYTPPPCGIYNPWMFCGLVTSCCVCPHRLH
jgi:hypothetical protein